MVVIYLTTEVIMFKLGVIVLLSSVKVFIQNKLSIPRGVEYVYFSVRFGGHNYI